MAVQIPQRVRNPTVYETKFDVINLPVGFAAMLNYAFNISALDGTGGGNDKLASARFEFERK
jgi:hypothetical protein